MNAALGPTRQSILHIHPLLRCNLSCTHCYSNSSPYAGEILSKEECIGVIQQARTWGYSTLSISGGEPLLYPWLYEIVEEAKTLGMAVSLISNGLLIKNYENFKIFHELDALAISLDGLAENHDLIRGRLRSFKQVQQGLSILADRGISYAINCSVTAQNIDDLEELTELAWTSGAIGIQFHPIELVGRAAHAHSFALTQNEARILFIAAKILAEEYTGRLSVHTDLIHRDWMLAYPEIVYAHPLEENLHAHAPGKLLGTLVLAPDGNLCPISYGFGAAYTLGNIRRTPMAQLWPNYLSKEYLRLRELGRQVFTSIKSENNTIINPNESLSTASQLTTAGNTLPIF